MCVCKRTLMIIHGNESILYIFLGIKNYLNQVYHYKVVNIDLLQEYSFYLCCILSAICAFPNTQRQKYEIQFDVAVTSAMITEMLLTRPALFTLEMKGDRYEDFFDWAAFDFMKTLESQIAIRNVLKTTFDYLWSISTGREFMPSQYAPSLIKFIDRQLTDH